MLANQAGTVSQGHEIHQYEFASAPYLGFPSSYDVHGDGSLVVALAGGHTTGSVVVFVTLPAGKRYAFIGDVAWQLEGVRGPAERPLMMRKLADVDPGQVRQDLLRVASLAGLMQVVPHTISPPTRGSRGWPLGQRRRSPSQSATPASNEGYYPESLRQYCETGIGQPFQAAV